MIKQTPTIQDLYCLGASLARVELQEGISRLLRRFPGLQLVGAPEEVVMTRNLLHHYPRELTVTW
ncbi:hypothetical protein [Frankia casuarinae]|uniref:hypothetical protein n=1 Tax=Frankia casuarinae (strain DSM 45818 / CECT 9043 / HFP020203 / CcI3) TaxID=106370 RepID=UPI000307B8C4|nr:hypothetical protein [Frankia casuarinae]